MVLKICMVLKTFRLCLVPRKFVEKCKGKKIKGKVEGMKK